MNIKVVIDDKEYTLEEARKLYLQLHELFGEPQYAPPYIPQWPTKFPSDDPQYWGPVITSGEDTIIRIES